MAEKTKTVQQELELRQKNKQSIHDWIGEQKGQPADIHEFIALQNKAEQKEQK